MAKEKIERNLGFHTRSLHTGYDPDPTTGARAVPIYQSTSFVFDNSEHAAALFGLQQFGNIYSRIMNPTTDVLEKRVASLENGVAALAVSSGQSAQVLALTSLMQAGDEFVSASTLYGGTWTQFDVSFRRFGMIPTFVEPDDPENFRKAITPKTKCLYAETISNPRGNVLDIEAIARIAHEHGIPLVVDNTFATPYLCRPIDFGADIVVHSLTKFMGGHGNSIGGIIVDSGKFPWAEHKARFPMMNTPEPAYHGVVYTEALGPAAYIGRTRTVPLRNTGSAMSPFNAFLFLQGIETLSLRMERHVSNAIAVAQHLEKHPSVQWVNYAGLKSSPYYQLAQKYTKGRPSALLTFGIKGGFEAGVKFYDALKIFKRLVNIGDAKSLAAHPASTTHRQLTEAELVGAGVPPDMIRLCVGIESIDDILEDINQALAVANA